MSDAKPNYELAFHISSNLDEAGIRGARQEIEKSVSSHGGVISFSREPERVRLAYPVKHQSNAYFGYLNFSLEESDRVSQIRDELNPNHDILRFLIIKLEEETKKKKEDLIRRMAAAERRRSRMSKAGEKSAGLKKEAPKMGEEAEKALEEKLEEIIEKL